MVEIIYRVSVERLHEAIEEIFTHIPEKAQQKIFDKVLRRVERNLKNMSPIKTGRLRGSIKTIKIGKYRAITGPTRKVGRYDLGLILEAGSKGGQIIRARRRSVWTPELRRKSDVELHEVPTRPGWLKFFWKKTGRTHYARQVTRGAIAPRRWVRNTVSRIFPELTEIVFSGFRREYERSAKQFN